MWEHHHDGHLGFNGRAEALHQTKSRPITSTTLLGGTSFRTGYAYISFYRLQEIIAIVVSGYPFDEIYSFGIETTGFFPFHMLSRTARVTIRAKRYFFPKDLPCK